MKLFITIFAFMPLWLHATRHTLQAVSGSIIISNNIVTPALADGDTLYIPGGGAYTNVEYQNLTSDTVKKIHIIWLKGSVVFSPVTFQQCYDFNVVGVVIENMHHFNWYGTRKESYNMHNIDFVKCVWNNPKDSYKAQPCIQWDDQFAAKPMVFTGNKAQTFYNNRYIDCRFDGFLNVTVVQLSANWNRANKEINRSICLDFVFLRDTFTNVANTPGTTVSAISGTGSNCRVEACYFKYISGPGTGHAAHSQSILWYGTIDVLRSKQEDSYAAMLRAVPLAWTGLPGYRNNAACRFYRNIIVRQLNYSAVEFGQNNVGNRDSAHGFYQCKAICVYNTVYATVRVTHNRPGYYYGFVCDVVNQDTIECKYNAGCKLEYDYPYDSLKRGYAVATVSRAALQSDIAENKIIPKYTTAVFLDTFHFVPGPLLRLQKPGEKYDFSDTDYAGNKLPLSGPLYAGAIEYKTAVKKSTKKK
ncbi:MAG: hypothetical protein ABIU63_07230 [Chitinophagaceae bacterium]